MFLTLILIVVVATISYFTIIKLAHRFPEHKDRLTDILVIGLIIFFIPQLLGDSLQYHRELSAIGLAIFGYGYILIIIYSFFQGYRGK